MSRGVACNLSSPGYAAMRDAFQEVTGSCKPMAITGTLPCACPGYACRSLFVLTQAPFHTLLAGIADLQDAGFDVQTLGFGLMRTYHALNECAKLSDMAIGFRVLAQIIANMDGQPLPEAQPSTKRAKH
jgi:acetylornithine deacetylase